MSEKIKRTSIVEEMEKAYLDYSMSVIVGRALPEVRDGLKPVHRRILYAMSKIGLTSQSSYKKSATVVGEVLGKYHPHGDLAVYDTLVRMAQEFSLRYPLIDGQGNFGSIDGDNAAAYRYTEARLSAIAEPMLKDIDKETVDFVPNFDASLQEPFVLPAAFPNLLVNGSSGIAVGMSTNIPPHNLAEICDGIIALMKNPAMEANELMEYIKGPDFPTRGIIVGTEGIKKAYKTGIGKVLVQAKTHYEKGVRGKEEIIITEIPYQLNKTTLIEQIANIVNKGKIEGISDLRDESDRDGIRIVIVLKQNADKKLVVNRLLKYTDLRRTFGVIILAIVDGVPKKLTLKELLIQYINHRREVVKRRSQYELDRAEKRAHILEGLRLALDQIDKIIETIKKSKNRDKAKANLIKKFRFSEEQSDAILDMRLARLTSLEKENIIQEYKEKIKLIEKLKSILSSNTRLDGVVTEELEKIKEQFSDKRRTEIIEGPVEDLSTESLVKEEEVVVTITKRGWVKRIPLYTYRSQGRGGIGVIGMPQKDNDYVNSLFIESTHDIMLLFTNKGKCYQLQVFDIPEGSRISKGTSLAQLLHMDSGEEPRGVITLREFEKGDNIVLVTRKGIIKKIELKDFKHAHSGGIIAQNLRKGDELITVKQVHKGNKILLASKKGQVIRFKESELRAMGRNAMGVIGMSLSGADEVISCVIEDKDTKNLLFISSNGYGKKVDISEFREIKRGGKGVIGMKLGERTGELRCMGGVEEDRDVMIITKDGNIIRLNSKDISKQHRPARGVHIVKLKEDDEVTDVALVVD
jgi:DNA gyrase subunit A